MLNFQCSNEWNLLTGSLRDINIGLGLHLSGDTSQRIWKSNGRVSPLLHQKLNLVISLPKRRHMEYQSCDIPMPTLGIVSALFVVQRYNSIFRR